MNSKLVLPDKTVGFILYYSALGVVLHFTVYIYIIHLHFLIYSLD